MVMLCAVYASGIVTVPVTVLAAVTSSDCTLICCADLLSSHHVVFAPRRLSVLDETGTIARPFNPRTFVHNVLRQVVGREVRRPCEPDVEPLWVGGGDRHIWPLCAVCTKAIMGEGDVEASPTVTHLPSSPSPLPISPPPPPPHSHPSSPSLYLPPILPPILPAHDTVQCLPPSFFRSILR